MIYIDKSWCTFQSTYDGAVRLQAVFCFFHIGSSSSSLVFSSSGGWKMGTGWVLRHNHNSSVYKAQNLVHRDLFSVHARTHTHSHIRTQATTHMKWATNRDLRWLKTAAWNGNMAEMSAEKEKISSSAVINTHSLCVGGVINTHTHFV